MAKNTSLSTTIANSAAILNNCPNMLFLFDENQNPVATSKAGKLISNTSWMKQMRGQNALVYTEHKQLNFEDKINLTSGQIMQVQVCICPFIDDSGACLGTIMAVNDITELALMRQQAQDTALTKNSFLSNMSHEIRTPINAIKGLSELLALSRLNNIQTTYIQNIITSVNSLLSIINDVLDFSKLDGGKIDLVEGEYSLNNLVIEVCNIISVRAAKKNLEFWVNLDPKLPTTLQGDDVRLKQIMLNLLTNAVKFTPKGRITFNLYAENVQANQLQLVFSVEDTGVGIKEEEIPFLFEPFSRADISANRNISGTGLGLTISRKLVETMNGQISTHSVYGEGSTFTVTLPQIIKNPEPLATVADAQQKQVLLLSQNQRLNHTAAMLKLLGINYQTLDTPQDTAINYHEFTHCIYDETCPVETVKHLRAHMPDCVFAVIKDMRYAMEQSDNYDTVLFIPLLITELVKVLLRQPRQAGSAEEERNIDTFALNNAQVLIVDDNEINLLVGEEILHSYKAIVTCAENGKTAIDLCSQTTFDIIFMDHMMPEMDGIETTLAIRDLAGPNQNTPIVALTANVVIDMREQYLSHGMNDFIAKPIEISDLSRVLRQWLPEHKIVPLQNAIKPVIEETEGYDDADFDATMKRIIASLDNFGMYVSDVMREIDNDYTLFLRRMERVRYELSPLVLKMRETVGNKRWDDFAAEIGEMAAMIHDVGARDCSGRARKLCQAGKEHNAEYINGDFYSLMDNMYMLQKKMEVTVPLVKGELAADVPLGDQSYCYGLLKDLQATLEREDMETTAALIESLSSYSLDHDLDMIINDIRAGLAKNDFTAALASHKEAMAHCQNSLELTATINQEYN